MRVSLSRRSLLYGGLSLGPAAWLEPYWPSAGQATTSGISQDEVARVNGVTYSTLADAVAAVLPGGVVEILPGTHVGSKAIATISKAITIRGLRRGSEIRPTISLGTAIVPKAILNPKANLVLEDLIIRGARTSPGAGDNAAGLKPEPSCLRMMVRRCDFVDNQNGVLTPRIAPGAIYNFEGCVFEDNGKGDLGYTHNVYFGRADRVTLTRCTFQHAFAGHEVKSRSLELILDNCHILNTRDGRAIDYPNGGKLRVVNGTVVRKTPTAKHRDLIGLSRESQMSDNRHSDFLFENSTLDNQRPSGVVIHNDARSRVTAIVRRCQIPGRTTMVGLVDVS